VLSSLGVEALLGRLHELGFSHLTQPASYYGLGLTLGSGEVSLWELTRAYAAMAHGGMDAPLRLIASAPSPAPVQIGERAPWMLVTDMLADPFARAKSFGLHSVLEMPFPAAVKTGTSSDFRDTWTVGFSRDYTVGVWIGNFDGSAMQGVSGVTGAGPLWSRIMLHLHERDEPPPFPAPAGYVRTQICTTTGHAPMHDCRAVVYEWVKPSDLAAVRRPVPEKLGSEYDPWLAQHPESAHSAFRIVFPHNGDVFVRDAVTTAVQAREQQIALRAAGTNGKVEWRVNGTALPLDSEGRAFWPVALGTWTVEARSGAHLDRITIRVVKPPEARGGFTR
jgi:penicillin-binding protein 1C